MPLAWVHLFGVIEDMTVFVFAFYQFVASFRSLCRFGHFGLSIRPIFVRAFGFIEHFLVSVRTLILGSCCINHVTVRSWCWSRHRSRRGSWSGPRRRCRSRCRCGRCWSRRRSWRGRCWCWCGSLLTLALLLGLFKNVCFILTAEVRCR